MGIGEFPVGPEDLAGMIVLITDGTISTKIARAEVFPEMVGSGVAARDVVEKKGLKQISDAGELETLVAKIVADNPKAAEDFKAGKHPPSGAHSHGKQSSCVACHHPHG